MRKVKFDKVITVLGFIAFALIILFIIEKLINVKSDNIDTLKVQGNARVVRNEDIPWEGDYEEAVLFDAVKGDVITITMEMPLEQFQNPVLVFQSGNNRIKVYQGEQYIYSFGELLYKRNAPISDTQLIVPLDLTKGNEITVEVTISKGVFLFDFPELLLVESMEVGRYKLMGNAVHTYIGLFLILFGIILFVFYCANLRKDYLHDNLELLILSTYSALGGVWMWTHYGILEMFWDNTYAIDCLNIISQFTMPILVLCFFHIKIQNQKTKIWFKGLTASAIIFVTVVLLLLSVKRFNPFISYIILWLYFILIITIFEWYLAREHIKNKSKLSGFILASVISYYISVVMCILTLLTDEFTFALFHKIYCNTIVFVIVQMFLAYVLPMVNHLQGKTEREVLIELAYVDGLTGLLNRNRSEEIMNQIRYDEENFYYVVEFEIMNLKKINRTYGYAKGDQMLIRFAADLKEAFKDAMLVSRYSGDEFIVILENADQTKLEYCLNMFVKKIDLYNEGKDDEAAIQYVYGIGECNCMIKGHDIYKMLRVADKRKYEKAKQVTFNK